MMRKMLYTSRSFTVTYPLEDADVVFLGVPFDSTAYSEGNQRYGPLTIRNCLKHRISYQRDLRNNPLSELKIHDAGDLEVVPGNFQKTSERIKETIEEIKEANSSALIFSLGGEHSISLPLVEAIKPDTVVQLDAHRDLDEELNGNKYTHNTWARRLGKEITLIQEGVREVTEEEDKFKVKRINNLDKDGETYLTIDIDCLDPAYAPDVGYPEPNGLTPSELDELLFQVFESKVVGIDLCEVASKQINNRTSHLAGWIVLRALGMYLHKN